ncbi:MAG: glycerate kinase, partial [Phycisphaerales bacterium]|nr:glycerate kinase [Phycisphaerales bacterium]
MKILIASDSFKGTLTARQATDAIARGVQQCLPTATMIRQPIADGGEGTVDVVLASKPGTKHTVEVTGPLATPVRAEFAMLDDQSTAVIEMAAASGLMLAPPESRDIMRATTFGTGELIAHALDLGATRILVGLGGSATCDGGLGCAQALGVRFFDADDVEISPRAGAAMLARVRRIDCDNVHPLLSRCKVTALCDVRNPLVGASGSARIFGPQKGA